MRLYQRIARDLETWTNPKSPKPEAEAVHERLQRYRADFPWPCSFEQDGEPLAAYEIHFPFGVVHVEKDYITSAIHSSYFAEICNMLVLEG